MTSETIARRRLDSSKKDLTSLASSTPRLSRKLEAKVFSLDLKQLERLFNRQVSTLETCTFDFSSTVLLQAEGPLQATYSGSSLLSASTKKMSTMCATHLKQWQKSGSKSMDSDLSDY